MFYEFTEFYYITIRDNEKIIGTGGYTIKHNLSNLDRTVSTNIEFEDSNGNVELQLFFYRINKIVICTGQVLAKNHYTYSAVIPEGFRPKKDTTLTGQCIDILSKVSTATLILGKDGSVYTNYPYKDQIFIATRAYSI